MIVFGIDPGVSGAISVFEDKKITTFFDMPTMIEGKKNKRQVNAAQLAHEIKSRIIDRDDSAVLIEQVGAMPGQGVTKRHCQDALAACDGDMEESVEWLMLNVSGN